MWVFFKGECKTFVLLSVICTSCTAEAGQLSMQNKADFEKDQQQETAIIDLTKTPKALDQTSKFLLGNVKLKAQLTNPANKFWAKHVDQGYFARFLRFPNAKTSRQKNTITGGQENMPLSCFRKDFLKQALHISAKKTNLDQSLLKAFKQEHQSRGLSTKEIT